MGSLDFCFLLISEFGKLRFKKSGIWDLRVEIWEQGVEKSESRIESGAGNADVGIEN